MRPTRASYSSITTYEACPLSYKLYYLDGHKTEGGSAAARGTRLHTACEKFLKGEIDHTKLSLDFRAIKGQLSIMKDLGAKAEEEWNCDQQWNFQPAEDDTTLIKAFVDIHYVMGKELTIFDLKTGKPYPEHFDQLQLYTVMGFSRYPEVQTITVAPLYLDGPVPPTTYTRPILPHLQDFWKTRARAPVEAQEFPATPSGEACRWCDYKKSKGGQCEFG